MTVEAFLLLWAMAATALWLTETICGDPVKSRVVEIPPEDPRQ